MVQIEDHLGRKVPHQRSFVNGIRLNFYTCGNGPTLLLLHGVPKTSYYWRKVVKILSDRFTLVCPDMRGLGDSDHPQVMDMATVAEDFAQLMTGLNYSKFAVVGEDWGAAAAYQLTTKYPERVSALIFQEMLLPGFGLEGCAALSADNVKSHRWLWHVNFYSVRDVPELLIQGREATYFDWFLRNECWDPSALGEEAIKEYVRCYSAPGGLRCMLEIYRATLIDAEQNTASSRTRLKMPVLAIGAENFLGNMVKRNMEEVALDVKYKSFPYGHQLAEECPDRLAETYSNFLAGKY